MRSLPGQSRTVVEGSNHLVAVIFSKSLGKSLAPPNQRKRNLVSSSNKTLAFIQLLSLHPVISRSLNQAIALPYSDRLPTSTSESSGGPSVGIFRPAFFDSAHAIPTYRQCY